MYVRFTSESGQSADMPASPLCAISGLTHRNKKVPLFDHLVGETCPAITHACS
jgi:hypothetical protein